LNTCAKEEENVLGNRNMFPAKKLSWVPESKTRALNVERISKLLLFMQTKIKKTMKESFHVWRKKCRLSAVAEKKQTGVCR
jgi:hypothetical protein